MPHRHTRRERTTPPTPPFSEEGGRSMAQVAAPCGKKRWKTAWHALQRGAGGPLPRRTRLLVPASLARGNGYAPGSLADAAGTVRAAPATRRPPSARRLDAPARATHHGPPDSILLAAIAGLLLVGLTMVYSASQLAVPGDPTYWFRRQALWAVIGLVALVVTARVDYHVWRRLFWGRASLAGMALTLLLLALVLKFGHTVYGAQRWLHLSLVSFQPSELAKLALALYIADWLAHKGDEVRSFFYGLLPFAVVTGLVLALVLMQNDMGSAVILACLAVAMFFVAGANLLQLVPALALGGGLFALYVAHSSFRVARLDAFLHPLPLGCADAASYQVCQGLIALGSGGIFGRGLGASVQKAGYLPNPFTDSIFAVLGEELGLLGCATVLALFAVLAYRGLRAGRRAPDRYGALLACGITCWLLVQAVLNTGSVVSALPFTGVPLPFVSYGGSSLCVALAGAGILLNIARAGRSP